MCPDWEDWDPNQGKKNATEAMDLAEEWLEVPKVRKTLLYTTLCMCRLMTPLSVALHLSDATPRERKKIPGYPQVAPVDSCIAKKSVTMCKVCIVIAAFAKMSMIMDRR